MTADLVPTPDRQPWERRKGESAKAHAAFVIYRDLGPTRSLTQVAQRLHDTHARRGGTVESIRTEMGRWSSKYEWQLRVEEYETARDRQQVADRHEAIRQMEERHIAASQGLYLAAMARIQGLKNRGNGLPDVDALDPSTLDEFTDIARVLEASVKIERLTRGMAPDISKALSHIPTAKAESMAVLVAETMLPYVLPGREHEALTAVQEALARHFNGPV